MSSNVVIQVPYLRTSRSFPEDIHHISIEMNKAYIDIANTVNVRTIGLFSTVNPTVNGEAWHLTQAQKQQGFRKAFVFTSTSAIAHGLNFSNVSMFTRCYGEFTDGTNWYGLISGSSVAIAGQISFYLTPTNITFVTGAGAPSITNGVLVLEWISNV